MISAANFSASVVIARNLGLEGYGEFVLSWMVILFFASLQQAAISAPMMTFGAVQSKNEEPSYYGAVSIQQAAWSALSFLMIISGAELVQLAWPAGAVRQLCFPLACVAMAWQTQDFVRRQLFTRRRARSAFACDVVAYLGQIACLLLMFSQHRVDAAGVLWIIAAMSTLATVVGYFLLGSMKYSRSRTMEVVRLHWPNGKWLVGAALSQWISGNLYILALGSAMGAVAVGALRSAQSIMGITHVVFLGLENVIPAEATRAHARGGRSELRQYLRKTAQFSFVATGLFGLVVSIDPNAVMALAFGEEFGAYGHLIWLFVLIYLLVSIGLSVRSGLRALNETRSIFTANVAAAILSIVTATYFTNTYGLLGAALGIFLVQIVIQTWTAADLLRRLTAGEGA